MFQSQNLFKTIQCPYFSQNNSNCERLYCPFRHPKETIKQESSNQIPTTSQADDAKLNKNLPNALENLSNALHTIQELFKQNDQTTNVTDESGSISSTIVSQLNNLSSVILSSIPGTSSESKKSQLTGSSLTAHLKKQQASAPAYNPTPLNELKKQRHQELTENAQKRKDESEQVETVKKLKTEESDTSLNKSPSNSSINSETKKIDLTTFSKMSLSQQVLKRYEMLNKPPPTSAAINQAKLKKKLDGTSSNSPAKATDPNVPQLILDTAPNATMRVPLVVRQKYLRIIFDSCRQIYHPVQLACQKASQNEKSIYDRSKTKQIYANLVAVLIKQLRSEMVQVQNEIGKKSINNSPTTSGASTSKTLNAIKNLQPKQPEKATYSHEALLNGARANKVSYSINKTKQLEFGDLSATQLYQMFYQYILTEKQLDDNSFPKWLDEESRLAFIPNFNSTSMKNSTEKQVKPSVDSFIDSKLVTKTCKRCSKNFYLNSNDNSYYNGNSECIFHWGKLRNVRVNKVIEQKYSCCSGGSTSFGCEEGKHVYDGDYDGHGRGTDLTGYVETKNPSSPLEMLHSKSSKNVYALDCEMCYTTRGLEVTRVSVVDLNFKTIYESLVKPDVEILDYNTRWSGLTESSLINCTKNLRQVQTEILRLVNKDTILIGHSLDSDFKALKLIHKNVIDTSVVFPHKLGAPYKRALRNLMSEYLQRIIQEDAEGHDSLEDATSCVHLMIWKINEDLRSNQKKFDFLRPNSQVQTTNFQVSNVSKSPGKLTQNDTILLNQVKAKIVDGQYMKQTQKSYTQMTSINVNTKTPQGVKVNSNS